MINVYAFAAVPPFAQGLVRDLRPRWALEEVGLPYRVTLVGEGEGQMPRAEYNKLQPFTQIPTIEDGDLRLFESGAIVQYIADKSGKLIPRDTAKRAEVVQWMWAALNTVELPVMHLVVLDIFHKPSEGTKEVRPAAVDFVNMRIAQLSAALGSKPYIAGEFSAADILLATTLRALRHTDLLEKQPTLVAYKERCEARPAFQKALAGQMEPFQAAAAA
jgi:glutathione S-transferase